MAIGLESRPKSNNTRFKRFYLESISDIRNLIYENNDQLVKLKENSGTLARYSKPKSFVIVPGFPPELYYHGEIKRPKKKDFAFEFFVSPIEPFSVRLRYECIEELVLEFLCEGTKYVREYSVVTPSQNLVSL